MKCHEVCSQWLVVACEGSGFRARETVHLDEHREKLLAELDMSSFLALARRHPFGAKFPVCLQTCSLIEKGHMATTRKKACILVEQEMGLGP